LHFKPKNKKTVHDTCKNSFMPQAFHIFVRFQITELLRLISNRVISGGDRTRMGGPQVPVPLLTYSWEPGERR
jgi:hypothetical protein